MNPKAWLERVWLGARTKFYEVRDPSSPDFESAMKIYEASFQASERASSGDITERLRTQQDYHLFVAKAGKKVVGMSIVRSYVNFVFYNYIATDPAYRSRGLGQKMFGDVRRRFKEDIKNSLGIVAEVDTEECTKPEEFGLVRRRIRYYRGKLKLRTMDGVAYLQPSYTGGSGLRMNLMILAPRGLRAIGGGAARDVVRTLYGDIYHKPADDPELEKVIESVPDVVELA